VSFARKEEEEKDVAWRGVWTLEQGSVFFCSPDEKRKKEQIPSYNGGGGKDRRQFSVWTTLVVAATAPLSLSLSSGWTD